MRIVTVDGRLTTLPGQQKIILKTTVTAFETSYDEPLTKAQAEVVIDGSQRVQLAEKEKGTYYTPDGFKIETGKSYQLKFTTAEGESYLSDVEVLYAVPVIKAIYDKFATQSVDIKSRTGTIAKYSANEVFVDYDDPANVQNYYLWEWTVWEYQQVCATCMQGLFMATPLNACVKSPNLPPDNLYDYFCGSDCWEILYSSTITTQSDVYSNGKSITGAQVAKVPYLRYDGCLIEVRQLSFSKGAFRYFKLLQAQSQTTGSLVDTPPAPIVGNVRNVNKPDESVVGYFYVADVSAQRHWIDRRTATGSIVPGGLLGRQVLPEPSAPLRPPPAPCVPSNTRTPIQPAGWMK